MSVRVIRATLGLEDLPRNKLGVFLMFQGKLCVWSSQSVSVGRGLRREPPGKQETQRSLARNKRGRLYRTAGQTSLKEEDLP